MNPLNPSEAIGLRLGALAWLDNLAEGKLNLKTMKKVIGGKHYLSEKVLVI